MTWFRRIFGSARLLALLLLLAFIGLRYWDPAPLETLRLKTFDLYQIAHPRVPKDYPVVIVDIDEKSLAAIGQWPWPRTTLANLVERVGALGARGLAFDVLFAEPDRLSPDLLSRRLDFLPAETVSELARLPSNDKVFADAFRALPVVLGEVGTISGTSAAPRSDGDAGTPQVSFLNGDPTGFLFNVPGLVRNLKTLETAAAGHGLFSIRPERDGVIRRVATVMQADGKALPSLAIELLRVTGSDGASATLIRRDELGVKDVAVGGQRFATDRHGQVWLHFSGRDPNRYVSAADVLDGSVDRARLDGKLVLVGTSAAGLFDLRATPIDRVMPGVEIHAQKLEGILSGELLQRPNFTIGAEVTLAIVIGLLIIILAPMLGALPVLILGGLTAASLVALSSYLFTQHRILLDVAYPLMSSFVIFLALTYVNYLREEAQRAQIRSAFSQYLSPALVNELTKDPERLQLGGETRELTILFSDVRGFTAIAESYRDNPSGLTTLMNELLTPLSNAIIERQGTIDKYMGDAVMAFWNAPLDDLEHSANGCSAALEMVQRMRALNVRLEAEARAAGRSHLPLEVGIGLATGPAMVGNMGSDLRFDYSVLGDRVNLASRLEGLTRQMGVPVLLADDTARQVEGQFATLAIDLVRVKGKTEPELVHALLGDATVLRSAEFKRLMAEFQHMRDAFLGTAWATSLSHLDSMERSATAFGLSDLLKTYRARIAELQASPPSHDWRGINNITEK